MKDKTVIINLSPQVDKKLIAVIKEELRSGNELLIINKGFDNHSLRELIKPTRVRNIEEFITEDDYQRVDFHIKDFVERLPSGNANYKFREAVTYKGCSLWQVIEHALFWLFLPIGQYKLITENIIRQEKPVRMVILGTRMPIIFWRDVERGLADRKFLRKIVSFFNNSRNGNLEEAVVFQVAKKHGINVKLEGNRGFFADIRYRISSGINIF